MRIVLAALPSSESRDCLASVFQEECQLDWRSSFSQVLEGYERHRYDFAVIDVAVLSQVPNGQEGAGPGPLAAAFAAIRKRAPAAEVIAVCTEDTVDLGVQAVREGARSYLPAPLQTEALRFAVDELFESVRRESEIDFLRDEVVRSEIPDLDRTKAPVMAEVLRKARMVAPTRSNVLLTGETGTGKGVLARFVHTHSNRKDGPFISVHCGAIPDTLIESELFGHERGAFTGATRRTPGKFEVAHGGTIFLDEIGTVQPAVQIKLLQVLQDRTVQRLGSERPVPVDVRVIAATNADLKEETATGRFRSDLYYRLSVFPIELPPLRERTEDVPRLLDGFLRGLRGHYGKDVRAVDPRVVRALRHYPWPGNIRELENLVERAFILEGTNVLSAESFPVELFAGESLQAEEIVDSSLTLAQVRQRCVDEVERRYLVEVLTRCKGKINETARIAGVGPRQLHKLMTRYGLEKSAFRHKDTS